MVQIVKYRNIYYIFSATLIVLSFLAIAVWGLKLGIDFKGGSLLYGNFSTVVPAQKDISDALPLITRFTFPACRTVLVISSYSRYQKKY